MYILAHNDISENGRLALRLLKDESGTIGMIRRYVPEMEECKMGDTFESDGNIFCTLPFGLADSTHTDIINVPEADFSAVYYDAAKIGTLYYAEEGGLIIILPDV